MIWRTGFFSYLARARPAAAVALVIVTGCGSALVRRSPAPADADTASSTTPAALDPGDFDRFAVEPVPVPNAFRAAVDAGTRTLDGRPGPRYWQQEVDYRISAELDPGTGRLQGEEVVTYRNNSPDTLRLLVFHLYQNLFREGEPRNRNVPITGGLTVDRVAVEGRQADPAGPGRAAPRRGEPAYRVDGTLMGLALPRPLAPGDSTEVELGWSFTVPPAGAPRMGRIGRELYNVAQWYPQIATYDDVHGWHASPYLGDGEFYLEYGDFDVAVTVPEGWIVAATGTLENAAEVLTPEVRDRLARGEESDEVVRVVTEEDLEPGAVTQRAPGGQLTWRFRAEDVRDFAFATSDRYLWDVTRATSPDADGDGSPESVVVHALYRPEATAWREAAGYTRHAVEFHAARWHPYIYPQMTSAEGPVGGMEYPMLTFVRAFGQPRTLYSVINHEVAHEWFGIVVGSNEAAFAWQDEGVTTYVENLATMDFFPDADPFSSEMQQYLQIAGTAAEKPMMRHADRYGPGPARVIASYRKPGFMLRALGAVIGEETLHRALAEYADRWHLKHPSPLDFFHTVEDVSGRDLDWFFHPWWYETGVLDQAIADVRVSGAGDGERVEVVIEDQGDNPMPVLLTVELEDGTARSARVPVRVWLDGRRRHATTIEAGGRVERIEIDAARIFPDVDRADNVWRRGAGTGM